MFLWEDQSPGYASQTGPFFRARRRGWKGPKHGSLRTPTRAQPDRLLDLPRHVVSV
ncbi:MAG: hypothetical protein WAK93_08885 [Solirubrobacteraceae bacterium]